MDDNRYSGEKTETGGEKSRGTGGTMKGYIALQIVCFVGVVFGSMSPGLLTGVFAVICPACAAYLFHMKPSPVSLIGYAAGFVLSGILSFSYYIFVVFFMYTLPFVILFFVTARGTGRKLSSYTGFSCLDGTFPENCPDSRRSVATALLTAAYFASFAVVFVTEVITVRGGFSGEIVFGYLDSIADGVKTAMTDAYLSMGVAPDQIPVDSITDAIQRVYAVSPGLVGTTCFVSAYFTTALFGRLAVRGGKSRLIFRDGWKFKLTVPSAVMFFVIFIGYVVSGAGNSALIYYAAVNLKIIMSHIFMFYGLGAVGDVLEEHEAGMGRSFRLTVYVVLVLFAGLMYVLLPIFGAYRIFRDEYLKRREKND